MSKKIVTVINRLVPHSNHWHVTQRLAAAVHEHIICINQIAVDVADNLRPAIGIDYPRRVIRREAETNNHAMHMCLAAGFAVPAECTVCKVDMYAGFKKRLPQQRNAFALRNFLCSPL